MILNKSPRLAESRTHRIDAVMDLYVTWRAECVAVADAYQSWRCAAREERGPTFDTYVAALDREEHAACAYQRLVEQVAAM
jgi:hypothetical protein